MRVIKLLCVTVCAAAVVLVCASILSARAQTASPQFLLTWKASGSYVPSFYKGKALPTYGSKITASLELVSRGSIVNIKNQTIYWYVNDTLVGGGIGLQTVTFPPFGDAPSTFNLRVELPNYPSGSLIHQVQIPLLQPEAVIYAPYPNGQSSANPISVKALPYFFNANSAANLSYSWAVNGEQGTNAENPDGADINLPSSTPSGTNLAVSLTISGQANSASAGASTNIVYK